MAVAMGLTLTAITSCEKENDLNPFIDFSLDDDEITSYYDDVLAEAEDITMQNGTKSGMDLGPGSGSRTVETTFSGDTVIHTITYNNFVNENSQFERVKNGVIIIKVLGRPLEMVFKRIISFYNFTINGNQIEGMKVVEKTGEYQYSITVTGGRISFTDGTVFTRNMSHTRTWTSGYETPFQVWDDEFAIDGTCSGVTRKNKTYLNVITSPLIVKNNCRWITEGVVELTVDNKTATLDYGDGTCDRFATVSVNGNTFQIRLRGGKQL